jgi:hypothetical protein
VPRRMDRSKQTEAERDMREILKTADPFMSEFVARHEALLERVTVLERKLESIVAYIDSDPSSEEDPPDVEAHVRWLAASALDA